MVDIRFAGGCSATMRVSSGRGYRSHQVLFSKIETDRLDPAFTTGYFDLFGVVLREDVAVYQGSCVLDASR